MTYHTWDLPARQTLVLLVDNMPDLKCLWDADASLSLNGNSNLQLTFCKYIWIVVTTCYYRWFIIIIVTWRRGSKIAISIGLRKLLVRNSWKKLAFFFALQLAELARLQTISCHLGTPQTILWLLPPPASSLWVMWCLRCTLAQILQLNPRCPPCPDPSTIYPLAEEPPPCCQIHVSHIARPLFWNLNPHRRFTLRKRCRN